MRRPGRASTRHCGSPVSGGRTALVAETLRYLAMLASNEGAYPEALDLRNRGHCRRSPRTVTSRRRATALAQHAVTLFLVGRIAESRQAFERTLPVFRSSGHVYRQAIVARQPRSIAQAQGDLTAGEQWAREAIAMVDPLGDLESGATDRIVLANVEIWSNRGLRPGSTCGRRSASRPTQVPQHRGRAPDLLPRRAARARSGDPDDTVRFARATAAAAQRGGGHAEPGARLVLLAYALLAAGSPAEAREMLTGHPPPSDTGVAAQALERDAIVIAADLALLPRGARGRAPTRALARSVADRLDAEALAAVLRPPSMLVTRRRAVRLPDPADVAAVGASLEVARAHLRRHLARPAATPGCRVPLGALVARLIALVGPG